MLFLLLKLNSHRLVVAADEVIEVLPLIDIDTVPLSPPGVTGVLNFRGTAVPVIDLCQLLLHRPSQPRLSTRILILHPPEQRSTGEQSFLGLIAEGATETIRRKPTEFTHSAVAINSAPYLGPVATDSIGLIQRIDTSRLWPEILRARDYLRTTDQKCF